LHKLIQQNVVNIRLNATLRYSGVVVNGREVRVPISAMPLFYWVATLGKLFTHIASPVFSDPRNWGYKGSIRTWPI